MFLRISRCLENFAQLSADSRRRNYSRRLPVRQLEGNFLRNVTGRQTFAVTCGGHRTSGVSFRNKLNSLESPLRNIDCLNRGLCKSSRNQQHEKKRRCNNRPSLSTATPSATRGGRTETPGKDPGEFRRRQHVLGSSARQILEHANFATGRGLRSRPVAESSRGFASTQARVARQGTRYGRRRSGRSAKPARRRLTSLYIARRHHEAARTHSSTNVRAAVCALISASSADVKLE